MQGCEEALTEYIQENLLIVATVAITFVVAEVHMHTQCAYDVIHKTRLCSLCVPGLKFGQYWGRQSVPNGDLCIII